MVLDVSAIPAECWCGAPLSLAQRRRHLYRQRWARKAGHPIDHVQPSCSRKCAVELKHLGDPTLRYRAGDASWKKRKSTLRSEQFMAKIAAMPPSRERDRIIWNNGYHAGLSSKQRKARRAEVERHFALTARNYAITSDIDG